jgi:hypothetical protein
MRFFAAYLMLFVFGATSVHAECDINYSEQCVPVASDVDCAGGRGDGPAYATGPILVIGDDIYGLDRDKDGVACEPNSKTHKSS